MRCECAVYSFRSVPCLLPSPVRRQTMTKLGDAEEGMVRAAVEGRGPPVPDRRRSAAALRWSGRPMGERADDHEI